MLKSNMQRRNMQNEQTNMIYAKLQYAKTYAQMSWARNVRWMQKHNMQNCNHGVCYTGAQIGETLS